MRSAIAIFLVFSMCQSALQVPVYRLIQFDHDGNSFGSQVASLNYLGAYFQNESEVPRKIALIHESSLSLDSLESTISLKPSALLIITSVGSAVNKEVQSYLGSTSFHFPIYFAHESEELMGIYKDLQMTGEQTIDSDQLQFSVSSDEKAMVKNLQQENYYGFVYEYSEGLPTIAIVTYFDAFSVVPELTKGMDSNGSGVVVLLELVKVLKKLYNQSPAPFNLMFLLTSSGTTSFQGLKHWLTTEEAELQQIRGGISFALCLDALGSGSDLVMHISRFHKEGENDIMNFYSQFNSTAEKKNINLQYNKKKVNMAEPFTPWQHETFAKNKIASATLSHFANSKTSIIDHSQLSDSEMNIEVVQRNIKYIGESLVKFLYGITETSIFNKADVLNGTYIAEVAEKFSEFNRFPTKTAPGSPFTLFLQGLLKDMSVAFKVQKYAATEVTLYSSKAETMSVYKVKPAMLDLYLFLTILGYLAVLWLVLKTCGKVSTSKSKRN